MCTVLRVRDVLPPVIFLCCQAFDAANGNCSYFPLHRYKHLNNMLKYHHILLVVCTIYHSNYCMFNECLSNLFVCVFNVQSNQFYAQPCPVCHNAAMREIPKVIIKINMEWVAEKISSSWWSLSGRAGLATLLPTGMTGTECWPRLVLSEKYKDLDPDVHCRETFCQPFIL